jgi:hypothetical protein
MRLILALCLILIACNPGKGDNDEHLNALKIDSQGYVAYVSYATHCPNCLRSRSALVKAATMHSNFKWNVLLIDDTVTNALPSKLFNIHVDQAKPTAQILNLLVTPEMRLMHNGRLIYQGAITDQNKELTQGKQKATRNYLMEACIAATINPDTSIQSQKAVGCFIEYQF